MVWFVAWLALAIFISVGCADMVGAPVAYGLFISTVLVGLFRLCYGGARGTIEAIVSLLLGSRR